MSKKVLLAILDGYGCNKEEKGNAIASEHPQNMLRFLGGYPNTCIHASGLDVGLPEGQMGNSEVGHTNIGAGRVVYQELTRITKSIKDKDFFDNEEFLEAIQNVKKNNSALHLMGLLSDGGVHSHNTHLYALIDLAKAQGLTNVFVHAFLDGRDVSPTSGAGFLSELEAYLTKAGVGKIATVMGRYYAMDRDNRWDRVQKGYEAMVMGVGEHNDNASSYVKKSYENDVTDEFVLPSIINKNGLIKENDSIIFFNFRPDRARELTRVFVDEKFDGFVREKGYFKNFFVCMTQYDVTMPNCIVAFKPDSLKNTFGEVISQMGLKQLRIAETEKYAHVTFFFNGGKEEAYKGEDRFLVPSPKVATYDHKPEMSAYEITKAVSERIEQDTYDVIVLNFANCDMVGHTGDFDATVSAVKAVDECIGKVADAMVLKGGIAVITADHGNADVMLDDENNVVTAHSTNPVPLIIVGYGDVNLRDDGNLADICPTILDMMEIEKPKEMTGKTLIIH